MEAVCEPESLTVQTKGSDAAFVAQNVAQDALDNLSDFARFDEKRDFVLHAVAHCRRCQRIGLVFACGFNGREAERPFPRPRWRGRSFPTRLEYPHGHMVGGTLTPST